MLFLSAGLLLLICAIFNLLRFLNDWLAKRGIIAIKTQHTILPEEGVSPPTYMECIAPPPTYDDAMTTNRQGLVQSIRLPSLRSSSPTYTGVPPTSEDANDIDNDEQLHDDVSDASGSGAEQSEAALSPQIANTAV